MLGEAFKLGFIGEDVTESSETRAWGESIPPTPPRKAPAISRDMMNIGILMILARAIWREPFRGVRGV